MGAFLKGIFMGLAITVSFGPGFIALFQTSIMKGIKAGFILATGILISDLVLILASYFGVSSFLKPDNYLFMGTIAGTILFVFGAVSFFKTSPVKLETEQVEISKTSPQSLLLKGFLVNIANPFTTIFWIGIIGYASGTYGMKSPGFFIFFIGLLFTAFSSDLLKCYLSGSLRRFFASRAILILNKIVGVVLMILGIVIFCKVL